VLRTNDVLRPNATGTLWKCNFKEKKCGSKRFCQDRHSDTELIRAYDIAAVNRAGKATLVQAASFEAHRCAMLLGPYEVGG
jgi:hypothetical protein